MADLKTIAATDLANLLNDLGADDYGFVNIENPAIQVDREYIDACFPKTKTLVSIVCHMNREPVKSLKRSVANLEFHHVGTQVDEIARNLVSKLEQQGIKAVNPAMAFPMELEDFPGRGWVVSHKLVAKEAGLGEIGIHRNLIHPKFGSFILLGTVLIEAEVDQLSTPIDFNPCFDCKLCVAACPLGAIKSDGYFDFSSCYTHNYQQFMGGFVNWVEDIADSKSAKDYREKVSYPETVLRWQSLSYKPNYNAAYCVAVCPAGENVIGEYLNDKKQHLNEVLKPFQNKTEQIYVTKDSDAEAHVLKRFPNKKPRVVRSNGRVTNIKNFILGMKLSFQRGQSKGLNATYHFSFTGLEAQKITIKIYGGKLEVFEGHIDKPNLEGEADSIAWVKFLNKEVSLFRCLATRKIKLKGSIKLLPAFGKCFPD
ncbi:MAG: SCP2 sterol-binding domain-containing protein [Methylophilaceae bacterium]|nr:MAG: SCP2 sterol-binding domain-containing protein [Methylophilaceae bacterium]